MGLGLGLGLSPGVKAVPSSDLLDRDKGYRLGPAFWNRGSPGAARRFYVPARIWPSALQERKRSHRRCLGKRSEVKRESERESEREMRQPNMAWRIPASRSEPAEVKLRRPEPWIDRVV